MPRISTLALGAAVALVLLPSGASATSLCPRIAKSRIAHVFGLRHVNEELLRTRHAPGGAAVTVCYIVAFDGNSPDNRSQKEYPAFLHKLVKGQIAVVQVETQAVKPGPEAHIFEEPFPQEVERERLHLQKGAVPVELLGAEGAAGWSGKGQAGQGGQTGYWWNMTTHRNLRLLIEESKHRPGVKYLTQMAKLAVPAFFSH